jgi:alkaline phosphatase D
MKPTRRQMLTGMSALALVPACKKRRSTHADTGISNPEPAPERDPEPEQLWVPSEPIDTEAFPSGVQVGDVGPDSALVSVWMSAETGQFMLAKSTGEGWEILPDSTPAIRDGVVAQVLIDGLEADAAYCVVAIADGARSTVSRFRTALGADGFRQVTIGATCCLRANHPWPSMSHVAGRRPDMFMLLGDTVYADHAETVEEYRTYWVEALTTAGLLDVSAASSLIATWDDHEVMNNFEGLHPSTDTERVAAALAAFREAIPQRVGDEGGLWRKLSWGKTADIFVLDGRGERDGEEIYLSAEQLAWIKTGLSESEARFKIIMNSVPITDYAAIFGNALKADRWQGYPGQRGELLDHIVGGEISGVLWITGDFHFGTASRVDPSGGVAFDQWEVMVGPGGSTLNIGAMLVEPSEQFPVIFAEWSSNLIHLDPGTGQVVVEWVGDDGAVIERMDLQL